MNSETALAALLVDAPAVKALHVTPDELPVEQLPGEQLEAAFEMFNRLSQQLTESYGELEAQVTRLSQELAEARSERIRQLAEKEQLANRLEVLLDALPAGVVVLDANDRVSQFNPSAQQMLGEDLNGMHWQAIARKNFIQDLDGLKLQDGRRLSLSARPLMQAMDTPQATDKQHAESGKIILITDVTEIHQLESRLNHQQRLTSLGEMVSSLAHQIRTPLSSALLYLSNIKHPNAQSADRQRYTDKAAQSLRHLERMVSDMLIFARGGMTESERFTVGSLMQRYQQLLQPLFDESDAQLIIENQVPEMSLTGNRDSLLSAFQNLARNALDARKHDCHRKLVFEVRVIRLSEETLEFSFRDNACGMSDEIKARVLEPFFTTRSSGTGLGLAVLNETVISHHGVLDIQTQAGLGSCFTVTLPVGMTHTVLNSQLSADAMIDRADKKYRLEHDLPDSCETGRSRLRVSMDMKTNNKSLENTREELSEVVL